MTPTPPQRAILTDGDLHAYLLGPAVGQTMAYLQQLIGTLLTRDARWNAAALLAERCRQQRVDWQEEVRNAFNICPHNLAERFVESVLAYRTLGSLFLPDLVPLALILLRTDLKSYFTPQAHPYRDHLAHQIRVAALAHLLLSKESIHLPRWQMFVQQRIEQWHNTREWALLVQHLTRLGWISALPTTAEQKRSLLSAAALLAGLVHDLGYALKYEVSHGSNPATAFERFGIFPAQAEHGIDPPCAPITDLFHTFWSDAGPGRRFATFREYVRTHPTSPHSLAGALWLAYLPERLRRSGLFCLPDDSDSTLRTHWGRLELVCQLAALMALAHDFPVDSTKKQGEQGFNLSGLAPEQTLVDAYPGCALFTLADVLHEFGRPFVFTGPTGLVVRAPILGIDLIDPDEWSGAGKLRKRNAWRNKGLMTKAQWDRSEKGERIELFWVMAQGAVAGDNQFPPPPAWRDTPHSSFDYRLVAQDVPSRLEAWGFDAIFCQRDVKSVKQAEDDRAITSRMINGKHSLDASPSVPPAAGGLAIYPLSTYDYSCRPVRQRLLLGGLQ
ncbi:MAG: hypothetical protein QNJ97_06990 [Myxococcota bacterium]|nr:hypothetical protein [Myxococcota bacterium]